MEWAILRVIVIGVFFLLSGCTSHPVVYTGRLPTEEIVNKGYGIGDISHVNIGDALLSVETIGEEDLRGLVLLDIYSPENSFSLSFANGTASFYKGGEYESDYHLNGKPLIKTDIVSRNKLPFVVYLPLRSNGMVDGDSLLYSNKESFEYSKSLSPHRNFRFDKLSASAKFNYVGKKIRVLDKSKNINYFKQELVYSGKTGNTIRVLYREYRSKYIREAFSHELTYNLEESKTIGYKNFKIDIFNASNDGISYKVVSD